MSTPKTGNLYPNRQPLPLIEAEAANKTPNGPAPGYRGAGNDGRLGALTLVSNNGFSWSSAISGIGGMFLYFNAQSLNPSGAVNRGHGLQLRCLSE